MHEGLQSPFAIGGAAEAQRAQELAWDIANLSLRSSPVIVEAQLNEINTNEDAKNAYIGDMQGHAIMQNDLWNSLHLDKMTGLLNKDAWEENLRQQVAAAEKTKDGQLAILFCDLDGFKAVNDAHGHKKGDEIIEEVANFLGTNLRTSSHNKTPDSVGHQTETHAHVPTSSSVSHWGGDEYAATIYLPARSLDVLPPFRRNGQLSTDERIEAVRTRLTAGVAELAEKMGVDFGISIGAAVWMPGRTAEVLLKRADEDMYQIKQARKESARRDWDSSKRTKVEDAEAVLRGYKIIR